MSLSASPSSDRRHRSFFETVMNSNLAPNERLNKSPDGKDIIDRARPSGKGPEEVFTRHMNGSAHPRPTKESHSTLEAANAMVGLAGLLSIEPTTKDAQPPKPVRARTMTLIEALPTETLAEIFLYACILLPSSFKPVTPDLYQKESDKGRISRRNRSSISSTCRRWRGVAVSTRSLWSNIWVEFHADEDLGQGVSAPTPQPCVPMLSLEIERAAKLPLNLIIDCTADLSTVPRLLNILRANLTFCKRIRISDIRGRCIRPLMSSSNGPTSFPHLESFIHCSPADVSPVHIDLSKAPRLKQVYASPSTNLIKFPTRSLLRLAWHPNNTIAGFKLAKSCKQLQLLDISLPPPNARNPLELERLDMSSLRHLACVGPEALNYLLGSVNAPNIQTLSLMTFGTYPRKNPFPTLGSLRLSQDVGIPELIERLRYFPYLRELYLASEQGWSQNVMQGLLRKDPNGGFELNPHLQLLCGRLEDPDLADRLIEARNGGVPEGPGMKFSVRIYHPRAADTAMMKARCKKSYEAFAGLRKQRPWSVKVLVSGNPFDPYAW